MGQGSAFLTSLPSDAKTVDPQTPFKVAGFKQKVFL